MITLALFFLIAANLKAEVICMINGSNPATQSTHEIIKPQQVKPIVQNQKFFEAIFYLNKENQASMQTAAALERCAKQIKNISLTFIETIDDAQLESLTIKDGNLEIFKTKLNPAFLNSPNKFKNLINEAISSHNNAIFRSSHEQHQSIEEQAYCSAINNIKRRE